MHRIPLVSWNNGIYHGCVLGKLHKDPFAPDQSWRAQAPLELAQGDISGPVPTLSFAIAWYNLTFIDSHIKCTWVYFIKFQGKIFNLLVSLRIVIENQLGRPIKRVRTNNGEEYVNKYLIEFCSKNGFQMQNIVPYTP